MPCHAMLCHAMLCSAPRASLCPALCLALPRVLLLTDLHNPVHPARIAVLVLEAVRCPKFQGCRSLEGSPRRVCLPPHSSSLPRRLFPIEKIHLDSLPASASLCQPDPDPALPTATCNKLSSFTLTHTLTLTLALALAHQTSNERSSPGARSISPVLGFPIESRQFGTSHTPPARRELTCSRARNTKNPSPSSISSGRLALLYQKSTRVHHRAPSLRLATRDQSIPSPLLCCLPVCDHRHFT